MQQICQKLNVNVKSTEVLDGEAWFQIHRKNYDLIVYDSDIKNNSHKNHFPNQNNSVKDIDLNSGSNSRW